MKQKAKMLQKAARVFIRPHKIAEGSPLPPSPAVILVRHGDLRGPVNAFLSLDPPPKIWVLSPFFDFCSCYEQYRSYTFSERRGKKPGKCSPMAALAAAAVVPLIRAMDAIPVYRGKRRVTETLEQTVERLKKGETVVIAADKDYTNRDAPVSSIHTGFFRLEPMYFDATGEHLPFCALRFDKNRAMTFSEPLYFSGEDSFTKERKQNTAAVIHFLNNETGS